MERQSITVLLGRLEVEQGRSCVSGSPLTWLGNSIGRPFQTAVQVIGCRIEANGSVPDSLELLYNERVGKKVLS